MGEIPLRSIFYQWESLLYRENLSRAKTYEQQFGYKVLSRHESQEANEVLFRVYSNNNHDMYLVGPFNDWGKSNLEDYKFNKLDESGFFELVTSNIKHKDPY